MGLGFLGVCLGLTLRIPGPARHLGIGTCSGKIREGQGLAAGVGPYSLVFWV